ncbi:hypothetical protein [Deinococcus sp. QL22]|uniref:hypothetical protein n=1 Tax=Deinococcus sp. QL22 TaxID=2939437 RepID=UPI002016DC88|nr:hypothetical protein [Deinococcus sp. QL22]UQN06505.1 hypothetical protein M1R55_00885 [Deinococcus sp. QL22]
MNAERYNTAVSLAGGHLRLRHPKPVLMDEVSRMRMSVGIYFGCSIDGRLDYVGSVARPEDPKACWSRMREHKSQKGKLWPWLWVLPLKDTTPKWIVRAIEGQLIDLFQPPGNEKHHPPRFIPFS